MESLRRMSPGDRMAAAADASDSVRVLVEAGIRARQPELTEAEIDAELSRILARNDASPTALESTTDHRRQ